MATEAVSHAAPPHPLAGRIPKRVTPHEGLPQRARQVPQDTPLLLQTLFFLLSPFLPLGRRLLLLLSFPLSPLLSGLCLRPLPRLLPVVLQAETHLEPNRTSLEDPLEIFSPTAPKWLWFEFSNELSAGKCSRNALTSVQKLCETSLALASSLGLTAFRRAACLGSPS